MALFDTYISTVNSSVDNLDSGNSYTFTGVAELTYHADLMLNLYADQPTTIQIQFSQDGTNWDSTITKYGRLGFNEFTTAVKGARYVRVIVTTSSLTTTAFRLQTQFGRFRQGNTSFSAQLSKDSDATVVRGDTEDEIMKGRVFGQMIVNKFSENSDVDAAEDIWEGGGDYTGFPTSAAEELQVASTSTNDTNSSGTGARKIRLWYLDDDYNGFDANGEFLTVDINLNGTSYVDSGVTGMRLWRAKIIESGSGETNDGDITIRWKTTTAVIFAKILAGQGQTEISNFTIPADARGYLKRILCTMRDNTANDASIAIKSRDFGSNTFIIGRPFGVTTEKDAVRDYYGGVKFAAKTDFIFRCTDVDNANGIITIDWDMLLVRD